jgi:hypothetical protein
MRDVDVPRRSRLARSQRELLAAEVDARIGDAGGREAPRGRVETVALAPRALVDSRGRMEPRGGAGARVGAEVCGPDRGERGGDLVRRGDPSRAAQVPRAHERRDRGIEGATRALRPREDLAQRRRELAADLDVSVRGCLVEAGAAGFPATS